LFGQPGLGFPHDDGLRVHILGGQFHGAFSVGGSQFLIECRVGFGFDQFFVGVNGFFEPPLLQKLSGLGYELIVGE
jgi:hypothetical protein